MAVQILMPKLGLTMKTGTVVKWLAAEGTAVRKKDTVLEIETEKLSYQVECPADGVLLKQIAAEGGEYPVAAVLGYVGAHGETVPDLPADSGRIETAVLPKLSGVVSAADTHGTRRVFISPVAKKLATELELDYRQIDGTGPNGRIVKADVLRFNESRAAAYIPQDYTVVPYTGIRRAIGENMLGAWSSIPMVTHHVRADVSALVQYRTMLNTGTTAKSERVSFGELIMKLTAAALKEWPYLNACLDGDKIILHNKVNLGMATALDNGLIVPVISNADRKNLLELSREAKELALHARAGTLSVDKLTGATFTVTNLGAYGSVDFFTPIINPPQSAILGVGRVTELAVPIDGTVVIRPMLGLSLTYDHRVVDGAAAAGFMRDFMRLLENPARAVML